MLYLCEALTDETEQEKAKAEIEEIEKFAKGQSASMKINAMLYTKGTRKPTLAGFLLYHLNWLKRFQMSDSQIAEVESAIYQILEVE